MYNGSKYITPGITREVDGYIQYVIWKLIDGLKIRKDYLQVFHLSYANVDGVEMQRIQHTQEYPAYCNEVFIQTEHPASVTVFVIENGFYSTMLLASEY